MQIVQLYYYLLVPEDLLILPTTFMSWALVKEIPLSKTVGSLTPIFDKGDLQSEKLQKMSNFLIYS